MCKGRERWMLYHRSQWSKNISISGFKAPQPQSPHAMWMVNRHVPAQASQVFTNIISDRKYTNRMVSINNAHNCAVDWAMVLHLLQTLPSNKGTILSQSFLESWQCKNISDRILGGKCLIGAMRAMCKWVYVWRASCLCISLSKSACKR
jgi:hypothetical protein